MRIVQLTRYSKMFHDLRHNTRILDRSRSHLIHLQTHPIMDLIVSKCYVILEGVVPGHAKLSTTRDRHQH